MSLSIEARKLISMFRTFVEKVFVPHLPKLDMACQREWTKFSAFLAVDQPPLNEMQLYVDNLTALAPMPTNPNGSFNGLNFNNVFNRNSAAERGDHKSPLFINSRKDSTSDPTAQQWNPMKTIGGQRNRILFQDDSSKDTAKDKEQSGIWLSTQAILPNLERLYKLYADNHTKLEKVGGGQLSMPGYQTRLYQG